MNNKKYIEIISAQADKLQRPHEMALSDFLDYLIEYFSVDAHLSGPEGFRQHVLRCTQKNPDFASIVFMWLDDVSKAMDAGRWLDVFGTIYEEMYLSRGKASKTGQFFTPPSVSDLMSDILPLDETRGKVNDCAAGSGRLLLAHYMKVSRNDHSAGRRFEYIAQDVDPIACKMCALNFMAHGMYGKVVCQNTLSMSKPSVTYYVNEVKYPFDTPYCSIRVVK